MNLENTKIAIIGLGYVGLPLAVEFGKHYEVIGFDIDNNRIKDLKSGLDNTLELTTQEINKSKFLSFTDQINDLKHCNTYIITVPTPIDKNNIPNLEPLKNASILVGDNLKKNNVVIYESTVFPGATEEVCVPILEKNSGLIFNKDFFVGYSPERINPGDKKHTITKIKKITSGSNDKSLEYVDRLYSSIVTAGTYRVNSIKVAEAAKVIENTQRDLNIALINELAVIFNKMNIDTEEVLLAAGTKWNFLNFRPGLVGGHCIGVDPYYLTYKSQMLGYDPDIILAGRKLNDGMGAYVGERLIDELISRNVSLENSKCLVMGITFKENCPDLRNSKVFNIIDFLHQNKIKIDVYDPWVNNKDKKLSSLNFNYIEFPRDDVYDSIIIAVGHDEFKKMGIKKIQNFGKQRKIIFDLKYTFSAKETDMRL